MSRKIKFCTSCVEYSMSLGCPSCGNETQVAGPPRFSPDDRFGEYRRRAKRELIGQEK